MRQTIITTIFALLLIGGALFVKNKISIKESKERKAPTKIETAVFTTEVKNSTLPIKLYSNGVLNAKKKIVISSEVQGVLEVGNKLFKAGNYYSAGATILKINSEEHQANLKAQKSSFQKLLVDIMPDLQLDFPNEYQKWLSYLNDIDLNGSLAALPKINSEKEKYFISSRNIIPSFYNINNTQIRLKKYNIRAPFNGVVTDVKVTEGSLVNPGQNLGEFISPNQYELEISMGVQFEKFLKKGETVNLYNLDRSKTWKGKVSRINGKIDNATQTIKIYIDITSKELKEGMFLDAEIKGDDMEDCFEISRKLIQEGNQLFLINGSQLLLKEVDVVFSYDKTFLVKGLKDGDIILAKPVPGAYDGMNIKTLTEK